MDIGDLLVDAFSRFVTDVEAAVDGLSADELAHRPDAEANSIAWLVWHATRVQDDHVAELAGREQAWTELGFVDRFGFELDRADTGYGHGPDQVAAVRPTGPDELLDYVHAVTDRTGEYVRGLDAAELDRIVDRSWDPPVTAGVRLVSVIDDCLQHAGQAAYVRGLVERRRETSDR